MSWSNLKAGISAVVKENNNQEITGANLQNVLITMINSLGANATCGGIAHPNTSPGTPDGPVFWIASGPGVYVNFGNTKIDNTGIFTWNGASWSFEELDFMKNMQTDIANSVLQSVSFGVTGNTATLTIKQKGYDAISVSVPIATDSQSGFMTAADKDKLDSTYSKQEIDAEVDEIREEMSDTMSEMVSRINGKQDKLVAGDDATRLNGTKLSTKQIFTGRIDTIAGAVPTLLPTGDCIYNSADKKLYIGDSNSQPVEVAMPDDFLFFSNGKLYHYQFGNFGEVETGTTLVAGDGATRINASALSTKQIYKGTVINTNGVPTLPVGAYCFNTATKKLYVGAQHDNAVVTDTVPMPDDFLFVDTASGTTYRCDGTTLQNIAAGELKVVNNLTEGGEESALSAEMGKVLAERLAEADAKWTDIADGEAMSVDCVKQIRCLTLTVIGDVYDSMSLDGVKNVMALTATYDDRSTEPITEFTVTGVVKAGNQNFIATYNGIKASLAVEVLHRTATLASISANSSVNEVSMWTETEELRKYITVTKVYSDSTTELTKDYTLSGELQQGASTITVSYDGDKTKTTTLTFTGVNDGSYVTDSLEAMVDFSDYADGYTGEIIDKAKGHQVVLNASLANAATKAPYGGIHGGKLVQAQWYEGTTGKGLSLDLKECAPAGVVTVELYARIRGKYSGSGATPTIGAISTFIIAMSSFAISPNSAYVNECRYAPQGEINLKGPAANPDITTTGLNLPYYDSSHTDVKELVHIVYTMANKLQKLYVNGQLIIDDSRGGYSCTGGTDVRIFPNPGYVAADIAVVRVYGKALNNKEVQRNYLNCQAKHGSQIN